MSGMLWTSAAFAEGRGEQADRDVQAVGEGRDRAGLPVRAEVREDLHRVAGLGPLLRGVGVLDRVGHPEPAPVVEREVQRLLDVRLGGHELDLEARAARAGPFAPPRATGAGTTRRPPPGRASGPLRACDQAATIRIAEGRSPERTADFAWSLSVGSLIRADLADSWHRATGAVQENRVRGVPSGSWRRISR